jgi:hypothetical protein
MSKRLYRMTWKEVKAEMSIAGSPDKITTVGQAILGTISGTVDYTNHAELTNIILALDRIKAEMRGAQKRIRTS